MGMPLRGFGIEEACARETPFLPSSSCWLWMSWQPFSMRLRKRTCSPRWWILESNIVSLFTDDVALVVRPVDREIRVALQIFDLFGDASGLRVNYYKSTATLIRCGALDQDHILHLLPYQAASFPCTYLGLPLSNKRLPKDCL